MYSPQGYNNGSVPVLQNGYHQGSCFNNNFLDTYSHQGYASNRPYFPSYENTNRPKLSTTNINGEISNCSISTLVSVPPPGYVVNGSINSARLPIQGPNPAIFAQNGYIGPSYGVPSFPCCSVPFPNSPVINSPNLPLSNFSMPPPPLDSSFSQQTMPFRIPPPSIPPPCLGNSDPSSSARSSYRGNVDNRSKYSGGNKQAFGNPTSNSKHKLFHCESCDRDFPLEKKYQQHMSEHIICGIEGCKFSAHAKIVEKHIAMQHRSGLFNRIVKGNTPEEIEKWISERKKHFPTKNKIETQQILREEMNKRGERYSESNKKFNNRYSNDRRKLNGVNKFNNKRQQPFNKRAFRKKSNDGDSQEQSPKTYVKKKSSCLSEELDDCVVRKLPPFRGTTHYLNAGDDNKLESIREVHTLVYGDSAPGINYFFDDCDSDVEVLNVHDNPPNSNQLERQQNSFKSADESDEIVEIYNSQTASSMLVVRKDSRIEISPVNENPKVNAGNVDVMSTSLDLLKTYHFSDDDDDESNEVDQTAVSEKHVDNFMSDSSEPEEYSSKISPIVENNISIHETHCESSKVIDPIDSNERKRHEEVIQSEKKVDDRPNDSEPEENVSPIIKKTELPLSVEETPNECAGATELPLSVEETPNECAGATDELDWKKNRKRKRHKGDISVNEEAKTEQEVKTEQEANIDDEKQICSNLTKYRRYRRPTLLEKLLANEIKHERNVILQCVRYVVQNNFFGAGQSK